MVYTDGAHLTADSLDELYSYANKIGLHPEWIDFMGRTLHPHFNICGHVKQRVLADSNVQQVTTKDIVRLCIQNFRCPETQEVTSDNNHVAATKYSHYLQPPSDSEFERMINNIFNRCGIRRSMS